MSCLRKLCLTVFGIVLILLCLSTVTATVGSFYFWLFLRSPAKPAFEHRQFFIPPKTGAYGVSKLLESEEVVRDARLFYLLGWLRNSLHRFQAGEYAFSTIATPEQVLDQIVNGRVVIHAATLPEGVTLWEVARIIAQKDLAPEEDVLRLAKDSEFIKSLGIQDHSLEGYLFPETYHFKKPVVGTAIIKAMVHQFWQHMPQDWPDRAGENGLNLHEIVTLASMIEKEAVVDSERPIIAGVFYNRLKIHMQLQSDPTAVYDIPGFSGPVKAAHLTRQSPYNTYYVKGLPIGPICSPGAKSLMAALYPAKVPYLYFVSNNDGTHRFSVTAEEHRKAVAHYYEMKQKAAGEKESGRPAETQDLPGGTGVLELHEKQGDGAQDTPSADKSKNLGQD